MVGPDHLNLAYCLDLLVVDFGLQWFDWAFRFDENEREFGVGVVPFVKIFLVVQLFLEFVLQYLDIVSLDLQLPLQLLHNLQLFLLGFVQLFHDLV